MSKEPSRIAPEAQPFPINKHNDVVCGCLLCANEPEIGTLMAVTYVQW